MPQVFDVIFAGGGTTACVVAGRLADADPFLRILVVESGQHSQDIAGHYQPCRYVQHVRPNSSTLSSHSGRPSSYLDGRVPVAQSARVVGGGSAVNFMMYVRGAASDYNGWAALGNKGWSFNELLPFIKKLETFTLTSERPTHGDSGPIQVSAAGNVLGFGSQLLKVAKEYDSTRPRVEDHNDFRTANAYSPAYKYVDPVSGRRSDAASRYLYPHLGNPNLRIEVGKRVKRVIIENGRAVGIEYTVDGMSSQGNSDVITVKATKMVVVSAGAFGSPGILERSGIGGRHVLEKHRVRVLVDLPGVGENYQDHFGAHPVFYASDETETMDDVWGNPNEISGRLKEWEANGTSKIAHNGIEAVVKMRPTANQLTSAGHALQLRWKKFFQNSPDKPMGMMVPFAGFPVDPSAGRGRKLLCGFYYIMYPESIGSVHITSGEDSNSPQDFDPNICSKAGDVAQLTVLYKLTRELFRRLPAYRGEMAAYHPVFPPGSAAACRERNMPAPTNAPNIVYSDADDDAIAKFHRDKVVMTWHSLGTCAMRPRNEGGVVDARLNVYGMEGLKVADLSICPINVGNNTYSTALLIGEKAASIIAEDLGLKKVRASRL